MPVANSDQVAVHRHQGELKVERTLSVERPEGLGTSPVDVAVTPDGGHLLVADAGTDEVAVFRLPGGRLPGEPQKAKQKKAKHEQKRARKATMSAVRQSDDWR